MKECKCKSCQENKSNPRFRNCPRCGCTQVMPDGYCINCMRKTMPKTLQHTPGPWEHSKGHIGSKIADFVRTDKINYDGMHIHNGEKRHGVSTKESEANARLIAAAPEMLDLMIDLLKNYECGNKVDEKLSAIIEKATRLSIKEILNL